jgi:deoxyribodipyrimidine photo-lyase
VPLVYRQGSSSSELQSNISLLIEPEQLANKSGLPYRVFTPFWKQLRQMPIATPVQVNTGQLRAPGDLPESLDLAHRLDA